MFGFMKKMFIEFLTSVANASNPTKCKSLNDLQCMRIINLHPNEHSQGFRYYPFAVNLDRFTLDDLSNRVCIPNKTEDL